MNKDTGELNDKELRELAFDALAHVEAAHVKILSIESNTLGRPQEDASAALDALDAAGARIKRFISILPASADPPQPHAECRCGGPTITVRELVPGSSGRKATFIFCQRCQREPENCPCQD